MQEDISKLNRVLSELKLLFNTLSITVELVSCLWSLKEVNSKWVNTGVKLWGAIHYKVYYWCIHFYKNSSKKKINKMIIT